MENRVTFRLSDKLLDLLNKEAIVADIKLSEQIRIVLERNYGLLNKDKLSDKDTIKSLSDKKWDIEAMIERQKLKGKPKVVGHLGSKRVE